MHFERENDYEKTFTRPVSRELFLYKNGTSANIEKDKHFI